MIFHPYGGHTPLPSFSKLDAVFVRLFGKRSVSSFVRENGRLLVDIELVLQVMTKVHEVMNSKSGSSIPQSNVWELECCT